MNEREYDDGLGGSAVWCTIIAITMCYAIYLKGAPAAIFVAEWLSVSSAIIAFGCWAGTRKDPETDFTTELLCHLKLGFFPYMAFMMPPAGLVCALLQFGESARRQYWHQSFDKLRYESSGNANNDTCRLFADQGVRHTESQAGELGQFVQEAPAAVCRTSLITATLAGAAAPAAAQQVSTQETVMSTYVTKNGVLAHDGPVTQTDFNVSLPRGFNADLWASWDFNTRPDFGKEVDYTISWSGHHLSAGLAYYDLSQVFRRGQDIVQPYVAASFPVHLGKRRLDGYAEFDWLHTTADTEHNLSGQFGSVGVRDHLNLHGWQLEGHAGLLYDTGLFAGQSVLLGRGSLEMSKHFGKSTLKPAIVQYSSPLNSVTDKQPQLSIGASASFTLH